jgi:UDP-N-acetylmuramate dehydrogenase
LDGEFKRIVLEDEDKLKCGAGASVSSVCRYALDNSLSGLEFAWGIPGSAGGAVYMNAGAYGGEVRDIFQSAMCIDDKGQESTFNENECGFSYRHSVFQENNMIITEAVLRLHKGDKKTISSKMDELLERRKTKQPLELPSAGSTFKRPAGGYAAALIDECGLKGTKVGGASVSTKHTGFIVNDGDASCTDVLELINVIRKRVKEYKGIDLECEVKIIGEF